MVTDKQRLKMEAQINIIFCPKCQRGEAVKGILPKFCGKCGTQIISKCPNPSCGAKITSVENRFCPKCGTQYSVPSQE